MLTRLSTFITLMGATHLFVATLSEEVPDCARPCILNAAASVGCIDASDLYVPLEVTGILNAHNIACQDMWLYWREQTGVADRSSAMHCLRMHVRLG